MLKIFLFMAPLLISQGSLACTDEYATMIHPQTGACVEATNGCTMDDLLAQGYRKAGSGQCQEAAASEASGSSSSSSHSFNEAGYDPRDSQNWWDNETPVEDWE